MARLPRLYAPSTVQYVVQHAAAGRDLFADGDDYATFVELLVEAARTHAVVLHAYALLPRSIHLLATPRTADGLPRVMQAIGRRYAPYANRRAGRSGALWERRYRSTLIDANDYLLATMRHIEWTPVAAGLASSPDDWRWSSYAHHVGTGQQAFLHDHAHYWALSDAPFERQAAYRTLAAHALAPALAARIDQAVAHGWVLGGAGFQAELAATVNRRGAPLARGRPRSVPV